MPETPCDHCVVVALADALAAKSGYFADPNVARVGRQLLAAWKKYDRDAHAARVAITVGCPTCGARADEWCRTNTGKPYDMSHGPAYTHAARRKALTELQPTA